MWRRIRVPEAHLLGWCRAAALGPGRVLVTTARHCLIATEADTPQPVAPMHERRSLPELVTLADGRVLATGGYTDTTPARVLASCELFDPVAATWEVAPAFASPRIGHAVVVVGDRALAIGGRDRMAVSGGELASVESWRPGEPAWRAHRPLPSPCAEPSAVVLRDGTLLAITDVALRWDAARDAWSPWDGGPARTRVALTALADGGAIAIGGRTGDRDVATVDVLDPEGTWRTGPALPDPRQGAAAIELADRRVVVIGGMGTRSNTQSSDLLYDWEADYRRARSQISLIECTDGAVLDGGLWRHRSFDKVVSPVIVPFDDTSVVVAGGFVAARVEP